MDEPDKGGLCSSRRRGSGRKLSGIKQSRRKRRAESRTRRRGSRLGRVLSVPGKLRKWHRKRRERRRSRRLSSAPAKSAQTDPLLHPQISEHSTSSDSTTPSCSTLGTEFHECAEQRFELRKIRRQRMKSYTPAVTSDTPRGDEKRSTCDVTPTGTPSDAYMTSEESTRQSAEVKGPGRKRRSTIPPRPQHSSSLLPILKRFLSGGGSGFPVNFSEPLSLLQRLTEVLMYSPILDKAAQTTDPLEQMCHVAAFSVSVYSFSKNRSNRPFNPLLGETYECDRTDDLGWKSISEQVCHHPPHSVMHAYGRGWELWQDVTPVLKLHGRSLEVVPNGEVHLAFTKTKTHYQWTKVRTTVHNLVFGTLRIEHTGISEVENLGTGIKCHMKFGHPSHNHPSTNRSVRGFVTDPSETIHWFLKGEWDSHLCEHNVASKNMKFSKNCWTKDLTEPEPKTLWKMIPLPTANTKIHNFYRFTMELNEPEELVAPTDSRNRPDQRLMEEGNWDTANEEKTKLEEYQRANSHKPYTPQWFSRDADSRNKISDETSTLYRCTGEYWPAKIKQDWSRCPDIYMKKSVTESGREK